jgi:hypothetical protein
MLPPTCVVVPTYWTRAGGESREGDAIYDHPTPLDGQDTLHALLESLAPLRAEFYVLILLAVTGEDVVRAAQERVAAIAARYTSHPTLLFGAEELKPLLSTLRAAGIASPESSLALQHYPTIRNLQLAVPLLLGSDQIVALDDDEIVSIPTS